MTIKIGSNIASTQAQRRLGEATASLGKIYERLSSGQRINTASDDAAGLAIANDLSTKNRVFTQAIRNGNDGISALNIADSALDNLTSVVTRIRELAEQSANGTYSSKQRAALDQEAQALKAEFLRISKTTTFNGVKLFDGSLGSGLRLQLGFGVEGSINTSVGGAIGTGSFGGRTSYTAETGGSHAITLGDLNGDGILDLVTAGSSGGVGRVTISLGTGSGSFSAATSYLTEAISSNAVTLGDLNGDGILDLVTAGYQGVDGYATVRLGTGSGSFGAATSYLTEGDSSNAVTLGDLNGDGILDLVTAGDYAGGFATVRLGTGTGTFGTATSYNSEGDRSFAVTLGDLNGDGILDLVTAGYTSSNGKVSVRLGTGTGTFGSVTSYTTNTSITYALTLGDLNGDGILDLVSTGNSSGSGRAAVRLGTGNGTFGASTSYVAEGGDSRAVLLGDLNGDGILDLVTSGYNGANGISSVRLGTGTGTFGSVTSFNQAGTNLLGLALGDLDSDGVLDLAAADNNGKAYISIGASKDGLAPLLDFSLKTKASALQAMGPMQNVQNNLAKQRGVIGAYQSRVGIALNNLSSSKENFSAAESRIRDADIATDAANLIRTQILQQAATSVLAQANQAPSLALTLLR